VAIIDAWQDLAPTAPDELAASLLVTASADTDQPPLVHVFGAMIGGQAEAERLLDEIVMRAGTDPASGSLTQLPYREGKRHLAEHGPGDDRPGHTFSKSEYFQRNVPAEALAVLVDNLAAGRVPGESRVLDFSPWGGAYNRVGPEATAFAHRDVNFLLKHEVLVDLAAPDAAREAARRWLARSWGYAHAWGSRGVYPNFPDPDIADWSPAYHGGGLDRLRRVKAHYDPDGLFR
jgi:hypothetical protein